LRHSLDDENKRIEELEARLQLASTPDALSYELSFRLWQLEIEKEAIKAEGERKQEQMRVML
jgi:hypothetical protein